MYVQVPGWTAAVYEQPAAAHAEPSVSAVANDVQTDASAVPVHVASTGATASTKVQPSAAGQSAANPVPAVHALLVAQSVPSV